MGQASRCRGIRVANRTVMRTIGQLRLTLSVGLRRFRSFILQFTPDFTELQLAWFNVAMAFYIFAQSLFSLQEDPPFYNALIKIAPSFLWEVLFLGVASFMFWARLKKSVDARQNASCLCMMIWVFLLCFLWSSLMWSSGKISIVHFISPVIVFSCMAVCLRLCAERRKISFDSILERRLNDTTEGELSCRSGSSYFSQSASL